MLLALYLGLLALIALLTAYTRNYQRTVVELDQELQADGRLVSPLQVVRTLLIVILWPAAFVFGLLFVAWWKAVALVVGAFLVLTPVMGSFTPRPRSEHFLKRVRDDVERRIAEEPGDPVELRRLAQGLAEKLDAPPSA